MIRRLRRRFVLFSMLIVTLVLSVVLSMMYRSARDSIINDSINMMRNIAMNPREHGRPDEKGEDIRLPFFTLRIDERGRVMARGGGYYDLSDEEFLNTLVDYVDISEAETGVIQEYNLRYLKMISPEHKDTIIVFADTSSGENAISGIKTASIVGGVIAFVIFLGLSILLSRLVVKPVEEAWNQQKQFVADASHELKTPLTVIMTNAEMLKEGEFSESQRNGFVDSILKMSDQMRGLVESLLELSRFDSGSAEMVSGSVNLSSVVSDSALTFEPVFFEKGRNLVTEIEDGISVKGNEAKLKQLVEILLDNALKYSDEGTETTLKLEKLPHNQCSISVADYGAEISKEDLKNIFKRFYRADKARGMNHSYGLGLAIAESIVSAHRGKISVESVNGINTFTVTLQSN